MDSVSKVSYVVALACCVDGHDKDAFCGDSADSASKVVFESMNCLYSYDFQSWRNFFTHGRNRCLRGASAATSLLLES